MKKAEKWCVCVCVGVGGIYHNTVHECRQETLFWSLLPLSLNLLVNTKLHHPCCWKLILHQCVIVLHVCVCNICCCGHVACVMTDSWQKVQTVSHTLPFPSPHTDAECDSTRQCFSLQEKIPPADFPFSLSPFCPPLFPLFTARKDRCDSRSQITCRCLTENAIKHLWRTCHPCDLETDGLRHFTSLRGLIFIQESSLLHTKVHGENHWFNIVPLVNPLSPPSVMC